jgi:hypothetical protein
MTPNKVQRKYPAYNNQGCAVYTLDIRAARCSEWVHPRNMKLDTHEEEGMRA